MPKSLTELLANYQPSPKTIKELQSVPKLFLVGISGAGKDTIIKKLLETGEYHLIVSHTTRAPRKNKGTLETDGVEYHFVTEGEVCRMLEQKEFIEAKRYAHNIYGTSVSEFSRAAAAHRIAVADIEVQGVEEYMALAPTSTHPVFLLPPDFDTWQERFKARYEGVVDRREFEVRLRTACNEIKHVLATSYYTIIINDDLDDTIAQVQAVAKGKKQTDAKRQQSLQTARQLLADLLTPNSL